MSKITGLTSLTLMDSFSTLTSWCRGLLAVGLGTMTAGLSSAAGVSTLPMGGITVQIAAGTGATRTTSAFSVPMLMPAAATGRMIGRITGVTNSTLTSNGAGWQSGQLSVRQTPHFVRLNTGVSAGRSFLISTVSANTATTITIDSSESVDLSSLGIVADAAVGDVYQIYAADTLSLILPLGAGVLGASTPAAADNVLLNSGGIWRTYYFSTTLGRWTQVALGSPDASHVPIRPDSAVQYSRLGSTAVTLRLMGEVPKTNRQTPIARQGVTFLASGWPVAMTLKNSQLQTTPGWRASTTPASADAIQMLTGGIWRRYYYDGTNWRQIALGSPISDSVALLPGTALLINRTVGTGSDVLNQAVPYGL